jgi:alpha-D-xyloside xylohydrolase
LTTIAALTVALACGGAAGARGATPQGLSWSAAPSPFRISFSAGGAPLVSEAALVSGPNARLSYRLTDGTPHAVTSLLDTTSIPDGTEYRVATDESARTALVDITRTATGARVSFALVPATGVKSTSESFAASGSEHFLGGGERPKPLDLRGTSVAIKASYSCRHTMSAPFYLSSAGYGISLRTTAIASMAFPGASLADACDGGVEPTCPLTAGLTVVQVCAKSAGLAYDVFAGTPEQVVSAYTATVGRPLLPPVDQFELIKWRDVYTGAAQVLEDADKLHALHIPIGWVELDNPWESSACYGSMIFDAGQFPDPAGMIAGLHQRSVKLMTWISPLVRKEYCPPTTLYPQSALFESGGSAYTIDLTDQTVRATFESRLRSLVSMGVDGFKADRGEEIDLEGKTLAGGSGATLHNLYPLLYAQAVADVIRASGKQSTFATMFRSGAPGSAAAVPGFWGGDQEGTFAGLQDAIHDGLSAAVAGYSTWGSDTGGYGSVGLTPEVFIRWAQFSAVTPVFEVGGAGGNATFWDFGEPTVSMFRAAAVLHYELFPYLYALTRNAHATGVPALRPLALEYPHDGQAWQQDLEVLVGHDLLAAPVTSSAAPQIYLPAGRWVDLATGAVRNGGSDAFTRPTPLDQLPLFLRAGAAIPFAARDPQIWPTPWPTDALQMANRGGWLYAPGSGRAKASSTEFGSFAATPSGKTITLQLTHAAAQTQVLLAGMRAQRSVRIDGKLVRERTVAALRSASSGWATTTTPFPGLVLKLAPRRTTTTVTLVAR